MTITVDVSEVHQALKPEDAGWATGMCDGLPWMAVYDYLYDRWRIDESRRFTFGQRIAIGKAIQKAIRGPSAADPAACGS